jgi:2-iminobutanoate/2-iminopropanoate deaminase
MTVKRKNYEALKKPVGAYVHAVEHDGKLYLSGLTAYGTAAQSGGIADQAKAVFDQIKSILSAEKVGMDSIIKVTVFVTELTDLGALRKVMFQEYGEHLPASSLVQVKALVLPELKIEIEAVAALSGA